MNREDELNSIVLGCLIHHLDDLVARSWADEEVPEQVKSAKRQAEELCEVAKWQALIARASELACGKDDRGAWTGEHLPLISLFSSVSLAGKSPSEVGWFPLGPLKETPIFPLTDDISDIPPLTCGEYQALCSKLFNELRELIEKEAFFPSTATLLMQKYTSYVPHEKVKPASAGDFLPDISLSDHLKQTAAFGTCLYTFAKTRNSSLENIQLDDLQGDYLLVAGDFSGVQEFIYTISSRGALKTLRARSFFLELLTLHAVEKIVEECELSPLNVLYAGGGRFSVLVPATGQIDRVLKDVRDRINVYLANVHDARLYLAMEWIRVTNLLKEDDFRPESPGFEQKMRGLYRQVEVAKRQKFKDTFLGSREGGAAFLWPFSPTCPKPEMVTGDGAAGKCVRCSRENVRPAHLVVKVHNRLGSISHRIHGCVCCLDTSKWGDRKTEGECRVCHAESAFLIDLPEPSLAGVEPRKEPVLVCPFCHDLYHLGEHLPASAFVVRKTGEPTYEESRASVFIERYYYCIKHKLDPADQKGNAQIWMLNEIEPSHFLEAVVEPEVLQNVWPLMVANHQPYVYQDGHRRPLDFGQLAGRATGTDKIGVLRMDVDDLGDIFAELLRRNPYGSAYFVRAGSLSRQLELFFKFHVNAFCLGHGLPQRPLNFSGFEPAPKRPKSWREGKGWGLEGRSVAVVYSGGDDLFIVGAWSDAAELAFDVHRAFKAYTAQNPDIDISGGLILTPKNYPLYHMADLSKEALEKVAKRHKETMGEDDKKKASIALFYTPYEKDSERSHIRKAIKWTQYGDVSNWITAEHVLKLMRLFSDLRERDDVKEAKAWQLKVSRSFLYDLFSIIEVYRRKGKLYLPRLHYILASQRLSTSDEESVKQWERLKSALMQLATIEYLPFVITWVDWLCREKAGD